MRAIARVASLGALFCVLAPPFASAQTHNPYGDTSCRTKVDFFAAVPKNQAVYGVFLSSPTPADVPVRLELYSATTLYAADLGHVVFGAGPALVFVRLPNSDVIDAVSDGRYDSVTDFPEKCGLPNFQVSRAQAAKAASYHFVPPKAPLEAINSFTEQTATYPAESLTHFAPPECAIPYNPEIGVRPKPPDYPDLGRQEGARGSTLVLLNIDASGSVRSATIKKSSGNAALDNATLQAARASTYAPMLFRCKGMSGQYVFHADFDSQ